MEEKEKTDNMVGRIPLSLWTRSPEVDPEIQYRDWRYSWERPWRPGLKVVGNIAADIVIEEQEQLRLILRRRQKKPARTDSGGTPFAGSSAAKQGD